VECSASQDGRLAKSTAEVVDMAVNYRTGATGEVLNRDPAMKLKPVYRWDCT
jgi:hypothetical protein